MIEHLDIEETVDLLRECDLFAVRAFTAYTHKASMFDTSKDLNLDSVIFLQTKIRTLIKKLHPLLEKK